MREQPSDLLSEIKHGTLPSKWRLVSLKSLVIEASYGLNNPSNEVGNTSILGMKNIRDGHLDLKNVSRVMATEAEREASRLRRGNLLINRTNSLDLVGKVAIVEKDLDHVFASYLVRLEPDEREVDPWFLCFWLNSRGAQRLIRRLATAAVGQANLNISEFQKHCLVPLPSLRLQHRIAAILRTWDEAIEKIERLIEAKTTRLDYWSRALMTGRRRLGRKRTNWPSVSLTEVTCEATARNRADQLGADAVMGVNKQHGMIPMRDHVRAADLSRYKIVRPGAFAYNPMRLNIGSIAQNDHGRDVLVSPDYVAFETDPGALLPAYFDHLRRTSIWSRFVKTAGSGGVRVRIYYEDLSDFVLDLPPVEEQARIVEALDTGRREIAILEQQRDALVKQKRGLMQKLLTGEWPVNAPKSREAAE
jgi:type I restriction enzyme S subunit